ncbi:MAG: hypothetical protein ACYC5Q_08495 [Thermoleophilia bacterium]
MPSFDTIAEWVLDNLYLAGGVTGAVLLGLLLVLLLILRGRRAPSKPTSEDMFGRAHQPTEEMDLQTPLAGNAEARSDEWLDDVDDAYRPREGEPSAAPAAHVSSPPPAAAMPFRATPGAGDEHVHSVITGLLQGRGDLTAAELRRIELLRPEKVLVALAEIEGALSGRGKEAQRARLVKLQQYAELLSPASSAEAPPQAEAETSVEHDEYVGVAHDAYDASSLWSGAAAEHVDTAADAADSLIGESRADAAFEGEPAPDLPVAAPVEEDVAPIEVIAEPVEQAAPVEEARAPWNEEPAATPDEEHETPAQTPAMPPGWSREGSADWLPGAIPAPEPVIGEAVWTEPEAGNETFHDERKDAEEEAWIDAPPELEKAATSLEALDLHLETAEDVLLLEVGEREDALAFLQPLELGRLFAATQDTHLKFSIIDILGREQDTGSIEALQACFDDPDPEVQMYALEVAERILGPD